MTVSLSGIQVAALLVHLEGVFQDVAGVEIGTPIGLATILEDDSLSHLWPLAGAYAQLAAALPSVAV